MAARQYNRWPWQGQPYDLDCLQLALMAAALSPLKAPKGAGGKPKMRRVPRSVMEALAAKNRSLE